LGVSIAVLLWLFVLAWSIFALATRVRAGTFGNALEAFITFLAGLNVYPVRGRSGRAAVTLSAIG
jgi:hypothetical protein